MSLNIKNKALFIWILISALIAVSLYAFSLWLSWYGTLVFGLYLFIPVLIVILIYFLAGIMINNHPKATPIIATILNIIIVFIIQLVFCSFLVLFISPLMERNVEKVKDYPHALKSIHWQNRISHFPLEIPQNAKDVVLLKERNNWFGSEELFLSFTSDKDYISEKLKEFEYINIEGPFYDSSFEYIYPLRYLNCNNFDIRGYKNYVIQNPEDEHPPFASGILLKENTIVFYYIYPD